MLLSQNPAHEKNEDEKAISCSRTQEGNESGMEIAKLLQSSRTKLKSSNEVRSRRGMDAMQASEPYCVPWPTSARFRKDRMALESVNVEKRAIGQVGKASVLGCFAGWRKAS